MKNRSTPLAVAAVVLSLACVLGGIFAKPVWAQVRAALVRDADHPARQAVIIRRFTNNTIFDPVYTVPAGKIFTLEHMNCTTLDASLYAGIFEFGLAHNNIFYSVPVTTTSNGVLVADGETRIYFNPGEVLYLRIFVSNLTTCTISGHTVDVTP
jgi:hypothetical protein